MPTTNFSFALPTVGGSTNTWGGDLNANWDQVDDLLSGTGEITPDLGSGWAIGGVAVTATAAELNLLDGVTATTAELNLLDGVTATTVELNLLDGLVATTAELNMLSGMTAAGAALLDDADAAAQVVTLGLNDALLMDERADHVNTPAAGKGEFWVRDDAPCVPVFTDDVGTDKVLASEAYVDAEIAAVPTPIKAWVNFDGTGTPSIRSSFNVSSITDNGVGDYTINFTNALSSANYALNGSADRPGFNRPLNVGPSGNVATPYTTTSARIICTNDAGGATDASLISVIIVG